MSLICAVPSFAELSAETGQDVIVISGAHTATRLRLDKVLPVRRGNTLLFRAVLSGGEPTAPLRNGTHLSRVGDFLVRLRVSRVVAEDGSEVYEAHAQAHLDQLEHVDQVEPVAV
jgi:hypothetical protein